jgi:TetR/AcrR family fatty acid metabolism transcriptional regulator
VAERSQSGPKRQKILEAAVIEMAQQGYYQTTVSMIARRAGVADGTIYLYFSNKKDILVSIFDHAMGRFINEGREQLRKNKGATAKLRRIVELHLGLLGEDRDLAVIFQVELRHSLHFMDMFSRSRIREYLEIITEVIREGQREGVFRPELDAALTAKAVFGILDEMATDWVLSRRNVRLGVKTGRIADFILGGLALREP